LIQEIGTYVPSFGLNSHGGLILVYLGGAMGINTWLMKGFFDSIPRDLDESAMIDGASDWLVFWRILFPLVRPILAVVGILTFIGTYNDYIIALTLLKDTNEQTLAVGLNIFLGDQFSQEWGIFSAGALLGAIPIVVLYLIMQDYIVGGLTAGAVKG
jgi:arabinogalactan oligomer/maltooligosaccharide transport system permease protein